MSRPNGNRKRRPSRFLPMHPHTVRELLRTCLHCGHMLYLNGRQIHWPDQCPAKGLQGAAR